MGSGPFGHALYLVVLFGTMMILYTGGNTSFNGFPFLANYVATDRYLPRQLTKRGHRLAFSNGIVLLGVVALALTLVFKAQVNGLVSLYAIGVFTGFTMAGIGHVRPPPTRRRAAPGARHDRQRDLGLRVGRGRPDLRDREVRGGGLGRRRPRPVDVRGALRLHRQYTVEDEALRAKR